jgi:ABC-type Fe3+-hydroxamate transport system substrate-binding protein
VIHDVLGHAFSCARPPSRVISLVPSVTETLFDLGAGDDVIAISDYCIFPPGLDLPRVGGTKNPQVDAIRALAPDLVHLNLEENLQRHGEAIAAFAPVFVSEPKRVSDVGTLLEQLGRLHGRERRAAELAGQLRDVESTMPHRSFTFACPIWKNPWMWCGGDTYVSHLIESAGGTNVLADRDRYPLLSLEEVLARRPEVVFLPDEPYLFTAADRASFPKERVIGPFPGHLVTWHGTRTLLGLEFLRDALSPESA